MRFSGRLASCLFLASIGLSAAVRAERTELEVRVLARGAKFLAGYTASVRVVLTDADTGEVLAQGLNDVAYAIRENFGPTRDSPDSCKTAQALARIVPADTPNAAVRFNEPVPYDCLRLETRATCAVAQDAGVGGRSVEEVMA